MSLDGGECREWREKILGESLCPVPPTYTSSPVDLFLRFAGGFWWGWRRSALNSTWGQGKSLCEDRVHWVQGTLAGGAGASVGRNGITGEQVQSKTSPLETGLGMKGRESFRVT